MLLPPARPVNNCAQRHATIVYNPAAGWQNGPALLVRRSFPEFPHPVRHAWLSRSNVRMN